MAVYPGGAPWSGEAALATEMATNDIVGLVDHSAGEFRKQAYSVFKSFFLKTNENRDVSANIEFQDTYKVLFGDDGDLEIYHTNPKSYIKNTKLDGLLDIILTRTGPIEKTMMSLDPSIGTNGSIAFDDTFLSNDGAIDTGIQILPLSSKFYGNINIQSKFINADGGVNKGLSFAAGGAALFDQKITVTGEGVFNDKIRANENIDLALNYINGDGADSKGLSFNAAGAATFAQALIGSSTGTFTGTVRTNNVFNVGGLAGVSQGFASFPAVMTFTGGILTSWVA